ncbi:MAG: ATP-binding protein [Chloroherpetonaceae bacterium]|nr:ATP-binding protein [Chloroherpetonaceae bacterium]
MARIASILSRLSLRARFFAVSFSLLFVSLVVVYVFVRPQYDKALMNERTTIVSEQLRYAIQAADKEFAERLRIAKRLAEIFSTRPQQFEFALKDQIATHSDLIRVSVLSLQTGDELQAQSSLYPSVDYAISENEWRPASLDSSIAFAFHRVDSATVVLATRFQTELAQKPYLLACHFDASDLFRALLSLPFGEATELALYLAKDDSLTSLGSSPNFKPFSELRLSSIPESRLSKREDETFLLVSSPFQSLPMRFVAAVPQRVILEPAKRLLWFSLSFLAVVLAVAFVAAWLASKQVTKPVQKLVEAVAPMQSLDFSRKIEPSELPELRVLSETIDAMRQTLDRYQKLNVEKIIVEEWKTRLLMSYSGDMIGVAGSDDKFTFQNERFAELCKELGFQDEPPTRQTFFSHPLVKIVKQSAQTDRASDFEMERHQSEINVTFGDSTESYRVQTVALRSQEKQLIGSFIILHDLTQERELERIKAETMNIVVHELRSPLNSVIGFSDLLLQPISFTDEERKEFISMIHDSGNKLLRLVNRFLDVMRLESGRQEIVKAKVNLALVVQALIDALRPQAQQKSVAFHFKQEGEEPIVMGSEELLSEAIQNLMTNAIKYGDPNRTIDLELRADSNRAIFSITDYGYGIPPEAQSKLFTKFYRVQSEKHSKEIGTGLGLAYVKEVVTRHGGSIALESNEKIGTRFTITLPTTVAEPAELNA